MSQHFTMGLPYDEVNDVCKVGAWFNYDGHGWEVVEVDMADQVYRVRLRRRVDYYSPREGGWGREFRWVTVEVI